MTVAPQSHAEILQVETGDDQGRRIAHLQDELERRVAGPVYALTPLCFSALAASAAPTPGTRAVPSLTFATREGKSLQVTLDLSVDATIAFLVRLQALVSNYKARRYVFAHRSTVNPT